MSSACSASLKTVKYPSNIIGAIGRQYQPDAHASFVENSFHVPSYLSLLIRSEFSSNTA